MPIVGHGIDIVETARIKGLVENHAQHFLDRVFTPAEQAYCSLNPKRYFEHLAGRFAAKEAVLKVLGTTDGVDLRSIEIVRPAERPEVRLAGTAAEIAREAQIDHIDVSLSHTGDLALAVAVGVLATQALTEPPPDADRRDT